MTLKQIPAKPMRAIAAIVSGSLADVRHRLQHLRGPERWLYADKIDCWAKVIPSIGIQPE